MMPSAPVRVWDVPTRLFHWLLAGLFGFSWWSAETGAMDWHRLSGICLLGLLIFRVIWGFAGGNTARFATFVRSPGRLVAYLRSDTNVLRSPGHNPVGGYSVVLMLLLLAAQIGSGLFAVDIDGLESGPLSYLVSFDQGRAAARIHHLVFSLFQIVAGLHILVILFYLVVRKRNLVRPMVTGADAHLDTTHGALVPAPVGRLLLAVAAAALLAWWTSTGFAL